MTIYDRIDNELKRRNISRRRLAQLSGININTMSTLFARRPEPFPENHLVKIADALDMPVRELKGFSLVEFRPSRSNNKDGLIATTSNQFHNVGDYSNSKASKQLLSSFNSLNDDGQRALLAVAAAFSIMSFA